MFSVQPPLLHSVKLESLDNLMNLSSDSSEGALLNIPPVLIFALNVSIMF
jgi:hypothetical protein